MLPAGRSSRPASTRPPLCPPRRRPRRRRRVEPSRARPRARPVELRWAPSPGTRARGPRSAPRSAPSRDERIRRRPPPRPAASAAAGAGGRAGPGRHVQEGVLGLPGGEGVHGEVTGLPCGLRPVDRRQAGPHPGLLPGRPPRPAAPGRVRATTARGPAAFGLRVAPVPGVADPWPPRGTARAMMSATAMVDLLPHAHVDVADRLEFETLIADTSATLMAAAP